MEKKKYEEGLVDGCFLTWVQVTEQFSEKGMITSKTKNFRKSD